MSHDEGEELEILFQDEATNKHEALTSILLRLSEIEAEASKMFTLLQKDGVNSTSKGKAFIILVKLKHSVLELEEFLESKSKS